MPLNRFYLTQDGWRPEEGACAQPLPGEMSAIDLLIGALPILDETAVSPPLSAAWRDSPPSHANAMAGDAPAMAAYLRQMTF